jgi:hypothetical protein
MADEIRATPGCHFGHVRLITSVEGDVHRGARRSHLDQVNRHRADRVHGAREIRQQRRAGGSVDAHRDRIARPWDKGAVHGWTGYDSRSKGTAGVMLTILLIVLLVLFLTGGIGYGYRGRRRV